jgi:PAS domain-containing protein
MSDPLDDAIRALFEDGRSGVLVLDREGLIVRANTNLRRLVARRVDLSPTRPGLSVFDEQERERVWSILGPAPLRRDRGTGRLHDTAGGQ